MPRPNRRAALIWLRMRQCCVFIFVCWHLFVLFITNTQLDGKWSDSTAGRYESYLNLDQAWGMFSSAWDHTPFPAVRLEFTDGSSELFLSDNEPRDTQRYFKTTMSRLRKYEEHILYLGSKHYGGSIDERDEKWKRYAEWRVQRWFEQHPDDQRQVKQVVLLKRRYEIPPPGKSRDFDRGPTTTELSTVVLQ